MGGDLQTTLNVLLGIAAGIVAFGGALGVIEKLKEKATTRSNEVAATVAKHATMLEKHAQYLDNDDKRLESMEETNRLIMRGVMQLMSHEIDGNHSAQLRETRDDMESYLINR